MGAVCCCFHVPDVEHNNNNHSSSHENSDDCLCPKCFVHKFMNKIRWSFHKEQVESIPSTSQQESSLISDELINNLSENSPRERVQENAENWYEDECPTCLEEYTKDNPKIILKCSHQYHLGCIYDWMERSENCPVCGKLMLFDESS